MPPTICFHSAAQGSEDDRVEVGVSTKEKELGIGVLKIWYFKFNNLYVQQLSQHVSSICKLANSMLLGMKADKDPVGGLSSR